MIEVYELYRALRAAGVEEALAHQAAAAVASSDDRTQLVTKADLRADIAELKADLTWRIVLMTGIFVAAVSALKVFG